jgi:hypothetical protein
MATVWQLDEYERSGGGNMLSVVKLLSSNNVIAELCDAHFTKSKLNDNKL